MLDQFISNLNLTETTTARQSKNGTRQFFDPQTNCSYSTHKSGYVRRIVHHRNGCDRYQLNPKAILQKQWPYSPINSHCSRRMIFNEVDRMELLIQGVINRRRRQLK
jgi:hypothetical protein